jgi:hypothetical protein
MPIIKTASILSVVALSLAGCVAVSRESDLAGEYIWSMNGVDFTLDIHADHTYAETAAANGAAEIASGRWSFEAGHMSFESLLVPGGVIHKAEQIIRGRFGLSAESHYCGPIMLILDPDRDLGFTRKRIGVAPRQR